MLIVSSMSFDPSSMPGIKCECKSVPKIDKSIGSNFDFLENMFLSIPITVKVWKFIGYDKLNFL
jgi:hypothetical protein